MLRGMVSPGRGGCNRYANAEVDPQPDDTVVGSHPYACTHVLMKTDDSSEVFRPFEQGEHMDNPL